MANTENIEAKLCAYIDGDLDAQGRAEIEKHLAANPQHRTLIAQLSKQRDLLRELPRESAPEEILDALQSQMERSVLLGDDDAARESDSMKIHRWPQLMAAAAIVLLSVGLGLVIYFVLPPGNGGDAHYATVARSGATLESDGERPSTESSSVALDPATASDALSGTLPGKSVAVAAAPPPTLMDDAAGQPLASKTGESPAALADAAGGGVLRKDKAADVFAPGAQVGTGAGEFAVVPGDLAGAQRELQNADLARQLKSAAPGGLQDNAMFVVVSTADPSSARSEVTNYLASNKITWDWVPHPTPELEVAEDQAVLLSRSQRVNVRMKNGDRQQQQQQQQQQEKQQSPAPEQSAIAKQQKKFESTSAAAGAAGAPGTGGAQEAQEGLAVQSPQASASEDKKQSEAEAVVQAPDVQAPGAASGAQPGLADAKQSMPQRPDVVTSNAIQPNEGLLQAATQALQQQQVQQQGQQQQVQQQKQMRVASPPTTESRLIIARGMTKQQAVELQSNLSKQTTVQRAAVYEQRPLAMKRERDLSPFGGGAATAPVTEQLQVYKELVVAPTSGPAASVDLGGWRDGDARTAMRQAAEAAPTTQGAPTELAATTAPTTLPLGTSDAVSLAVPTTAPAAGVADERLDVVILVEDDVPVPATPEIMEDPASPNVAPNAAPAAPVPTTGAAAAPTTQPAPDLTPAP